MTATLANVIVKEEERIDIDGDVIEIVVGQGEQLKTFFVHQNLLTGRSDFFRNAMKRSWAEAEEKLVILPEDDATVFAQYLQLLYLKKLPIEPEQPNELLPLAYQGMYKNLANIYVLAEKLQDIDARVLVLQTILARTRMVVNGRRYFPTETAISIIYSGTPEASPARHLLVDLHVDRGRADWFGESSEIYHHDFLFDLVVQMSEKRTKPLHDISGTCSFDKYDETKLKSIVP